MINKYGKMQLEELCKLNIKQMDLLELYKVAKRVDDIKKKFDWYIKIGGISAMVNDGIDVVQFKIDYAKIEKMNKKLDELFGCYNEDRKECLKEKKYEEKIDFNNLSIDDLVEIDYNELNEKELDKVQKRVEQIKEDFDWYLENGGVSAMINDGIDVAQFKVDYNRIMLVEFNITFALNKNKENREEQTL